MAKAKPIVKKEWSADLTVEDEYGQPEQWSFQFKRPSTRSMLSFTKAQSEGSDAEKVEHVIDALHGVLLSATCNGVVCDVDDMPFEMFMEVLGLHPTFRSTTDEGS